MLAANYNVLTNLKLSVGGVWRSGQPYNKPITGNETVKDGNNTIVNYNTPNSENLKSYKRVDVSLSHHFKVSQNTSAILRAGVINVINEKNSLSRHYVIDFNDLEKTIQIDDEALTLTPNLSSRIKF